MATKADKLGATASRLLSSFGEQLTFARDTKGGYSPSTGKPGASSAFTYTAFCVFSSYSASEVDGNVIKTGDSRVTFEPGKTVPQVGDTVEKAGQTWRVLNVSYVELNGQAVLYKLQVRR